jgi:hypothetical protein
MWPLEIIMFKEQFVLNVLRISAETCCTSLIIMFKEQFVLNVLRISAETCCTSFLFIGLKCTPILLHHLAQ